MPAYPARALAWTTVAMLTVAYIMSYVDRSILGLLVEPIKADLGVSDEAMGYLIGPAFGLFYATVGLPLGWLADRGARTRIVAAGVLLWSAATIGSGLARGYAHLFVARMGVGVGEAALSPCTISLIADSFPPERRGLPVGVYSAALSVGAGLGSIGIAFLLEWAGSGTVTLPIVGAVRPWQFALIAVGLPGLVLGLVFLLLPEPARHDATTRPSRFGDAFSYVAAQPLAIAGVALLVAVMTTIAYSQQFNAPAFARTFGWAAKDYAKVNGTINLIVGPATVILIGMLIDRLRHRGRRDAAFAVLVAGFVPMLPLSAIPLFMPTPALAFAMLALSTITIGTVTAAGILALLAVTPGAMRGQLVALYYMVISIAGLGLGPSTVGLLSTRVVGETNLRVAIAAIPIIYGLVPLLLLSAIRRSYARVAATIEGTPA